MPKLPALNSKMIMAILKKRGFELNHTSGSHFVFRHPENKRRVTIPFHRKDLAKGTLLSILKQSGISKNDLQSL